MVTSASRPEPLPQQGNGVSAHDELIRIVENRELHKTPILGDAFKLLLSIKSQIAGEHDPRTLPPSRLDAVLDDIRERKAMGLAKYGTTLQAHNGRDALVDAYQEALDLCAYLTQKRMEGGL